MRRILFAVNVLIGLAAIAVLAAYFWVFYRALPETSGSVPAFVAQRVEVARDSLGVPHIRAQSFEDANFINGYITAGDRLWQMDTLRRVAAGELSEILGPGTLELDREARRLRLRRIAEQQYALLDPEDKKVLTAYARGVNAYIESHRGRSGFEFVLLHYDPRPWTVTDSLMIGLQMFRTLASDWKTKLIKEQMLRNGEPDKVNFLFSLRSGGEIAPGGDVHPGSNAWAVAGSHTAGGKPLLSSDMHLEFGLPGIWHMVHLSAPGLNVAGVELPGVPGVIVGHNDRIAWGITNLGFDVQDLYLERMDVRTGQYLFQGHLEQARRERDVIAVKGRPAEEIVTWVTRHGPVFIAENGRIMTLKWAAADATIFRNPFPRIDRARNWDEFRAAVSQFGGPGQNFVYADVDGNIGYQASGKLPIRRNYAGDVPVDGSTGANEWDGYIPFDDLPRAYNPPNGYVVTANQNPFPPDYQYHVGGKFASQYRSRQILNLLLAGGGNLKPEDNLRIQKDVYSGFDLFLAHQVVAAYEKRGAVNPMLDSAVAMLKTWDGQMDRDRPEPFITTLVFQYLGKAAAERAAPGSGPGYELENPSLASSSVERLLKERPADWFGDYNQLLLRCFADAMDEGQRIQGKDPKNWRWGKVLFLKLDHPVGNRIPVIGRCFNVGSATWLSWIPLAGRCFSTEPVPMSGGPNTVKQTSRRLGPSERMDASVGNWDDSLMDLPVGESGHFASSHYRDEWDAYYAGRSFPMQFGKVDANSTMAFVPVGSR